MPELPEVETIVRGLRNRIGNLRFSGVEVFLENCLQGAKGPLVAGIRRKRIRSVDRRGKNILISVEGGKVLRVHLGMTGRLRLVPGDAPRDKHTHLVFSFFHHPLQLRFEDPRRFGRVFWEGAEGGKGGGLSHLGPEALEIRASDFISRALSRRREIKPLLLDQHFLAGVGNIYADESLHRAGIHPRRRPQSLGAESLGRLLKSLQAVLRESILCGGSSVRSFVDAGGSPGRFQHFLRVYGREGEPCLACGGKIVRESVGGRSSFFCPRCQRG